MKIRSALALGVIWLTFAQTPGRAEDVPQPGSADSRVRTVAYNEKNVVRLNGVYRTAMQLVFSEGEEVSAVALGDSTSWEVAPSSNLVFIKPREKAPPTNLIISTRKGSVVRSYQFVLAAASGPIENNSAAMFKVVFTYPTDERAAAVQKERENLRLKALEVEGQAVELALMSADIAGPRNLNYVIAGSSDLAPSEISDNGVSTILRFPNRQAIPAIFKVLGDGEEATVAYDVRGDFVVIHDVLPELRLRRGNQLACIKNNAFERFGPTIGTGTTSNAVVRSVEGQ